VRPLDSVWISKLESEEVVRLEAEESGLRAVNFRLPMAYGARNLGNLPRMIRWADRGLPFPLFQPDNLRSMVYVGTSCTPSCSPSGKLPVACPHTS